MQMEATECGAASLAMILGYYGKWLPLEQVRHDCGVSRDGSQARNILRAARAHGLEGHAYSMGFNAFVSLRGKGSGFPCIVFWDFNHFIVVKGVSSRYVYANDPARGAIKIDFEEFERCFTGVVLTFEPTPAFERGSKPPSMFSFARSSIARVPSTLALLALIVALVSIFELCEALFPRVLLDVVLSGESPSYLVPLAYAMGCCAIAYAATCCLRDVKMLHVQGKLATSASASFVWHLLHLPMEFYAQRSVGDLQQRQAANESIAFLLVNQIAPVFVDIVMLCLYLVVMLRYSVALTIVGIVGTVINLWAVRYLARQRVNITRRQMSDVGKLYSSTLNGIDSIETIKATGTTQGFFEQWAGFQSSVNEAEVQLAHQTSYLGTLPTLVDALSNVLVLVLGALLVMRGSFTAGMLLAFQGLLGSFLVPMESVMSMGQAIEEMRTEVERIQDVMGYAADVSEDVVPLDYEAEVVAEKLSGCIEVNHVSFGYSRFEAPTVRDFSLSVEPGSWIALVGASGSGKSTIAKLIANLYQPWEGRVTFDGRDASEIPRDVLRGSLAVVDQDVVMFEDTVAENVKLWDRSIEDFEVILACRDAGMHDEIVRRRDGYASRLTPRGGNFSGGQLQRLEIARVLAQDPTIVIFDEATSALDSKTERQVMDNVRARGITCIIVAHRLSTIRDCDEILVLDGGEVVERGTHRELVEKNGRYVTLMRNG